MGNLNKYGEIIDNPNCPGCNKPIKDDWVACPHCGASLLADHEPERQEIEPVDDGKTCPVCGESKDPTVSHFCPACGEHVNTNDGDYCIKCRKMVHDDCMIPSTHYKLEGKCPVCNGSLIRMNQLSKRLEK